MKRTTLYFLITILSFTVSYGQVIEEKEQELFKKYKVQERTKYDYSYINGKKSSESVKSAVSQYKNGMVLLNQYFSKSGDITRSEKFDYDQNGNRILYERKSARGDYKKQAEYDTEDNVILESGYDGSSAFKTSYKYVGNSNRISEIAYYVDNMLDEKRVYEYTGNTAKVKILHKGKTLKSTIYLKFNSDDQITEEKIISLEGVELEKRIVEYNSQGNITSEEKYRAGKLSYKYTYQYNSKGELICLNEESSKGKFDKKLYQYDDMGRVIEYKWTRKPGEEYNSKTFKYGDKGVCIEEHTLYPATNFQITSTYSYSFY